jgi:hypothetical protein
MSSEAATKACSPRDPIPIQAPTDRRSLWSNTETERALWNERLAAGIVELANPVLESASRTRNDARRR